MFFLSFFPSLTRAFSSSLMGLPTKRTMRCFWFLFWRCFSASCATWMPLEKWPSPSMRTVCRFVRILPTSDVSVTCTCLETY